MKVQLNEQQFNELNKMLTGIARKYAGWGGISFDDLLQECWVKALKVIDTVGELRLNLIAVSCYNHIFGLCRYQQRRANQIPVEHSQFEYRDEAVDNLEFSPIEGWTPIQQTTEEIVFDKLAIDDIENLFNPGSVESEYVHLVAVYLRIKQPRSSVNFEIIFNENSPMENNIAISLGYANSMSSGYRNCKKRVRKVIAEHMGWGDNYNHKC